MATRCLGYVQRAGVIYGTSREAARNASTSLRFHVRTHTGKMVSK
jgi:hypothetical protein